MDKVKRLSVAEAFYSIQGEGKTTGVPSVFLRLAGCNLMCGGHGTQKDGQLHDGATWRCDSIEVWMKGTMYEPQQLVDHLNAEIGFINLMRKGAHLIITGGEPMMQQEGIADFLDYLFEKYTIYPFVEFETNGTIPIRNRYLVRLNTQFNISPKLQNSGMSEEVRAIHKDYFGPNNKQFKFVVGTSEDIEEVCRIIKQFDIPVNDVWLMPAASTRRELSLYADFIVKKALKIGCNYSHRLHIEMWDKKTGV